METTLHQQLKEYYCKPGCETEVKLGRYRIDVVDGDRLIEIQHSGLASIRSKIQELVKKHQVDVIKPIISRKKLIKLARKNGKVVSERLSPKRGGFLEFIDEMLYFTRVFPHRNLRIITPMIEVEEIRYPGHGKRRRKRAGDFVVHDRVMTKLVSSQTYCTAQDLYGDIPKIAEPFDTQQLAEAMGLQRWQAQRVAYVLKHTKAFKAVGKKGNAITYRLNRRRTKKSKVA